MGKEYQCKCGHITYSEAKDGPGNILWSDGHTCRFKPMEGDDNEPSKCSENS